MLVSSNNIWKVEQIISFDVGFCDDLTMIFFLVFTTLIGYSVKINRNSRRCLKGHLKCSALFVGNSPLKGQNWGIFLLVKNTHAF